jgi:beta-lactamase regulating signal transducer with metallopeptidase domain
MCRPSDDVQWPCNTPSEDSLKSKTNTTTGKTMLRLVKIQITQIFLKLWIFTNLYVVFPVVVSLLVFEFDEFSEGVSHGHCKTIKLTCGTKVLLKSQPTGPRILLNPHPVPVLPHPHPLASLTLIGA